MPLTGLPFKRKVTVPVGATPKLWDCTVMLEVNGEPTCANEREGVLIVVGAGVML